ncbi:PAS domain S-box protein [Pelomyxa schiedti]|nr:PAS domain S-box protein [Pelomyxa schiedti]
MHQKHAEVRIMESDGETDGYQDEPTDGPTINGANCGPGATSVIVCTGSPRESAQGGADAASVSSASGSVTRQRNGSLSSSTTTNSASTSTSNSSSSSASSPEPLRKVVQSGGDWLKFVTQAPNVVPPKLVIVLEFIQFIQILSFCLDPQWDWGDDKILNSALEGISVPRNLTYGILYKQYFALWLLFFGYVLFSTLLGIGLFLKSRDSGHVPKFGRKIFGCLVELLSTILWAPFTHVMFHIVSCYIKTQSGSCPSSNSALALLVLSCIGIILGAVIGLCGAAIQYPFNLKSNHPLSRLFSRCETVQFLMVAILSALSSFVPLFSSTDLLPRLLSNIVLLCFCGIELCQLIWCLPYHHWWTNYFKIASFFTIAISAIVSLIGAFLHSGTIAICILAAFVPVGILAVVFSKLAFTCYLQPWKRKLYNAVCRAGTAEGDIRDIALKPRIVTLAATKLFWEVIDQQEERVPCKDSSDRMTQILLLSIDSYPAWTSLRIVFCLFTIEATDELQTVAKTIHHVHSLKQWPDSKLLLFRLDEERRKKMKAIDGGREEIELGFKEAARFNYKAKQAQDRFWQQLLLQNLADVTTTVAEIHHAESCAEQIYKNLRLKFPNSVNVLRQYAKFLDEIKHDYQEANILLSLADSMEERNATEHRSHLTGRRIKVKPINDEDIELPAKSAASLKDVIQAESSQRNFKNQQQLLAYKERLSDMHSFQFRLLSFSIIALLFVILANLCVAFALTEHGIKNFSLSFRNAYVASNLSALVPQIGLQCQRLIAHSQDSSYSTLSQIQGVLTASSESFLKLEETLESDAKHDVDNIWSQSLFNVSIYNPTTGTKTWMTEDFRMVLREFSRNAADLAMKNHTTTEEWYADKNLRFLMDNGYAIVRPVLDQVARAYRDQAVVIEKRDKKILSIVLPVTVFLLTLGILCLLYRSLLLMQKEQQSVLRLFLCIPQMTVMRIQKENKKELADSTLFPSSNSGGSSSKLLRTEKGKYISQLSFRALLGTATCILFVVIIAIFGVIELKQFLVPLDYTMSRTLLRSAMRLTHVRCIALILKDVVTYGSLTTIHVSISKSVATYYAQTPRLETSSVGLEMGLFDEILNNRNCSTFLPEGRCAGLDEADNIYMVSAASLNTDLEEDLTLANQNFLTCDSINEGAIWPWHLELEKSLYDAFLRKIYKTQGILVSLFLISALISFLQYLSLRGPLLQIQQEVEHTLRMFLLLPVDVINSTPEIRHFLETGDRLTNTAQMSRVLREAQTKTDRILQAAADAIILYSTTTLKIDTVNAAAEAMFGWSSADIIGQDISAILGANWVTSQRDTTSEKNTETIAIHKDGSEFPVLVSKSIAILESGDVSIAIVRDLRDVRGYKDLLDRHESLLQSMLPKVIVERLKALKGQHQSIADQHSEVSILFADIVAFSSWSTTIDADRLVHLLDMLFSMWDEKAVIFGVEKIKTIGDCYMAVCGCPETNTTHARTLVLFGVELIRSLVEFNKENGTDLHVRVGINSGPVVAGVIGKSKVMYDIWGPSVNMASRMESSGVADVIQITLHTAKILKGEFALEPRGEIQVKGGVRVDAFLIRPSQELRSSARTISESPSIRSRISHPLF